MSYTYQSWGREYPRMTADLTGNHAADIIGFGYDGVWVSLNDGQGNFSPPNMGVTDFCIATGWSIEKHARFLAVLTETGYPDIVGFGNAGVYVSRGTGHSSLYSKISEGWQSSTLQMASRVLNRIAFALPVLSMERLDSVRPTFSESSFNDIFRLAIITSRFTTIGIDYTVNSFSV